MLSLDTATMLANIVYLDELISESVGLPRTDSDVILEAAQHNGLQVLLEDIAKLNRIVRGGISGVAHLTNEEYKDYMRSHSSSIKSIGASHGRGGRMFEVLVAKGEGSPLLLGTEEMYNGNIKVMVTGAFDVASDVYNRIADRLGLERVQLLSKIVSGLSKMSKKSGK